MVNKTLVLEKLNKIKEYLKEIEEIINLKTQEILKDFRNIKTLERNFQLIVDEMLDINLHLISELKLKVPSDFQSSFLIIASSKILPLKFAQKIAPVVGLRNKLVHRYEEIDKTFFIKQLKKERKDFIKYINYINRYLATL